MINVEKIKEYIREEKYEYYAQALTEAKKDGIDPEDITFVLLTGKIIESYPERQRVLIYGRMLSDLPVHVVCDYSDKELLYIVTVYIPSKAAWSHNFKKRKRYNSNV